MLKSIIFDTMSEKLPEENVVIYNMLMLCGTFNMLLEIQTLF